MIKDLLKPKARRQLVLLITLGGFLLRLWAAWMLPPDADEPVYLGVAADYAQMLRSGDWNAIIDYRENSEHPPLVKLLYGGVIVALGDDLAQDWARLGGRGLSAIFGALGVLLTALINPLAGALLAVHTMVVKYTSEVYLEALPLFFCIAAVFGMLKTKEGRDRWFWLSGAALGLTAASKFSYFPVVIVLLYLAFFEKKVHPARILVYLILAGFVFFAFNPALWRDPYNRLLDSILFHAAYSQGAHVQEVGYPWYQPLIWVSRSHPYQWHPDVFFYFGFDGIFFWATVFGFKKAWKEQRWAAVWVAAGMIFLLAWPTKWPQYTLVVAPAFCLAAAPALTSAYNWLREQESYWDWFKTMLPHPTRTTIIIALALVGLFVVGAIANFASNAVGHWGWSGFEALNSPLPANAVNDLLLLPDGRMLLATDNGLAIWQKAAPNELLDHWQVLDKTRSPLPADEVLTLALAPAGEVWVGTTRGIVVMGPGAFLTSNLAFQVYSAADLGLASDQINDLALTPQGGVWAATQAGAAYWDGRAWRAYPEVGMAGSAPRPVFSLAVRCPVAETPCPVETETWFGSTAGVSRLDAAGDWMHFDSKELEIGWGGFSSLMVDSQNRLWASNLGGGASIWDGQAWTNLRISNSGLPYNSVQAVYELAPGEYWISTAIPNSAGGRLSRLKDGQWKVFEPVRSGYSGAEVVSIAQDSDGRLWFATLTDGVDIYEP